MFLLAAIYRYVRQMEQSEETLLQKKRSLADEKMRASEWTNSIFKTVLSKIVLLKNESRELLL